MKRKAEKHMAYYEVLDALARTAECALCTLETGSLKRYFDTLLYEMVNDPKVRSELSHSRGYCYRHANMLLDCRSSYGTGILYQDHVAAFIECLRDLLSNSSRRLSAKAAREWNTHPGCPACRVQKECRERSISLFLKGVAEPDMRGAFERGAGFCIPHFFLVIESISDPDARAYVTRVQQERYEDLLHDLREFDRKHDYRFADEPMGKEGDSWARAVRMIVGQRDLL